MSLKPGDYCDSPLAALDILGSLVSGACSHTTRTSNGPRASPQVPHVLSVTKCEAVIRTAGRQNQTLHPRCRIQLCMNSENKLQCTMGLDS